MKNLSKTILALAAVCGLHVAARAQNPDLVVAPGVPGCYNTINEAVQAAPERSEKPVIILIKNGIYREKVIIDRPRICLVGEDRDSTRIIFPELSSKRTIREFKGRPVGNGVVVLMEGADDCLLARMTIYNNYGSTVGPTTAHQMAVFGRATRTIIVNCNVWADGNDDVSLWAPGGNGMYYHADCDFRCPGVDFVCPRGWCYVTRCRFRGNGPAQIWHDGRGDESKKLVITDSRFDADSPCILGRYHHDSQFYLLNCTLTDKIVDHEIGYAYSDKVLDVLEWGNRVYMYNVKRDGGNYKWMKDNLQEAKGAPKPEDITPAWTFAGKWDPEAEVEALWPLIGYEKQRVN